LGSWGAGAGGEGGEGSGDSDKGEMSGWGMGELTAEADGEGGVGPVADVRAGVAEEAEGGDGQGELEGAVGFWVGD